MDESPSFKANQFANKAEEYFRKGDLANACTCHFRAAELFLLAINDTKDPEAVKTLKLLYANHTRNGKDLQRRLNSSQPTTQTHPASSTPVIPVPSSSFISDHTSTGPQPSRKAIRIQSSNPVVLETGPSQSMMAGSTHFFMGQSGQIAKEQETYMAMSGLENIINTDVYSKPNTESMKLNSKVGGAKELSPSTSITNSYLLLDNNAREIKSSNDTEDEDPFNKFWDAVEGLVHKISGPVAFTTAPLSKSDEKVQGRMAQPVNNIIPIDQSAILNSYLVVKPGGEDLEESRYEPHNVVPVRQPPNQFIQSRQYRKTNEEYEVENQHLKKTIDQLSKRVAELERAQQENDLLRSSIMQFRNDIQKQRNPQLHLSIPPASNSNRPIIPGPSSSSRKKLSMSTYSPNTQDSQDLNQKVEALQRELARAQETILFQQKKWNKLKDAVKKKGEPKAGSTEEMSSILNDQLDPEQFNAPLSITSPGPTESSLYYSSHPGS